MHFIYSSFPHFQQPFLSYNIISPKYKSAFRATNRHGGFNISPLKSLRRALGSQTKERNSKWQWRWWETWNGRHFVSYKHISKVRSTRRWKSSVSQEVGGAEILTLSPGTGFPNSLHGSCFCASYLTFLALCLLTCNRGVMMLTYIQHIIDISFIYAQAVQDTGFLGGGHSPFPLLASSSLPIRSKASGSFFLDTHQVVSRAAK